MKGAIAVSSSLNDRSGASWVLVLGFVELLVKLRISRTLWLKVHFCSGK